MTAGRHWWWRGLVALALAVGLPVLFGIIAHSIILTGQPVLLDRIVHFLYPHFDAELARLGPEFMVEKARSVGGRAAISVLMFPVVFWLLQWADARYVFAPQQAQRMLRAWGGIGLWLGKDLWPDLLWLGEYSFLYRPVLPARLLLASYPPAWLLVLLALVHAGCAAWLLWRGRRSPQWVALLLWLAVVLQSSLLFSFGKIDHTYTSYLYAGFGLIGYLSFRNGYLKNRMLHLAVLMVAMCYLMPAMEKLIVSGPTWVSAHTLQGYLRVQPTPWGLWLAQQPMLCRLAMVLGWLLQAFFWLVVLWPRLRWPLVAAGVLFHWGTYVLLGAGAWDSPWVLTLLGVVAVVPTARRASHRAPGE